MNDLIPELSFVILIKIKDLVIHNALTTTPMHPFTYGMKYVKCESLSHILFSTDNKKADFY
jgi:hypothetical protein